jgi:hypothetical protein
LISRRIFSSSPFEEDGATGLVVVGDLVGSGEAQERGIVGETPNLAVRLRRRPPLPPAMSYFAES